MRENSKLALLIALLHVALLLAVMGMQTPKALAVVRSPGVDVGFWAQYYGEESGNAYGIVNFTASATNTVKAVSGTNVTIDFTVDYQNGTVQNQTLWVDVDSGKGNGSPWFIATNLGAGDLVYTNTDPYNMLNGTTINETITKDYLGSFEVNHVNLTRQWVSGPPYNVTYSFDSNYYWYRGMGALAEWSYDFSMKNQTYTQWGHIHVLITGIVPEIPPTLIVPLILIIPLITVLLSKALPTRWRLRRKQ